MEWLIDALRDPLAEVVNLAATVLLAAVVARIRGKQRRVNEELRENGLLPPAHPGSKPSGS